MKKSYIVKFQQYHFLSSVFTETTPIEVYKWALWTSLKTVIKPPLSNSFFWRDVNNIFGFSDLIFQLG